MKIGVDARALSGPVCGIRRYTECLLAELVKGGHRWFLYLPSPARRGNWDAANVKVRCSKMGSPWLKVAWGHTALPTMAARDGVDLLWSPSHRLPRVLPGRIRTVVTIHDLVWLHFPDSMNLFTRVLDRLEMPRALKNSDWVIAVSHATGNEVISAFPDVRHKLTVVHEGLVLDTEEQAVNDWVFPLAATEYLLCVGTQEPRKNYARTIAAFAQLVGDGQYPGLALVIVGRKGWGEDLMSLKEKLRVPNRVYLLGEVESGVLARLYLDARGFLMPSLHEGFGLPLLEAMHFGVPILTSGRSAMREIVGDCAVLVDPESTDSIVHGMTRLLEEEGLAVRMRVCGEDRLRQFSWERAAQETLAVFERAVMTS